MMGENIEELVKMLVQDKNKYKVEQMKKKCIIDGKMQKDIMKKIIKDKEGKEIL